MDLGNNQSKEKWKDGVEANKISGCNDNPTAVNGLCVRIGSMRRHSQAITLKLKKDLLVSEIEAISVDVSDWVRVIPDEREVSIHEPTPAKVIGTPSVPVGRIRKLETGGEYISAFTAGDRLLWDATEPLRRVSRIILGSL